jgi:hypothetical protein
VSRSSLTGQDLPSKEASSSFGRGSSKFFLILILPRMLPAQRAAPLGRVRHYPRNRFPCLGNEISSPFATSATSRESCVLA